jgi:cytochrome c oxidase cbb3-type subunit 1
MLFVAYALIGIWAIIAFRFRQPGHVYVSQWYILAALFWFPWLYSIAQIMLVFAPVQGAVQPLVNWWFAHNVLGLWFTPIGLASIYYFLPKVLGKPIHSYYLSALGFWSLALFYNWAGVHHLIGGPEPAWVISAGVVASLLMVIPVVTTGINHHMTMIGSFGRLKDSPTLRFIFFGGVSYTLTSLIGSAMAVRSFNEIVHFTHFTVSHAHHGLYAFFTMVMFGAIYYMLPRLTGREWPSATLISVHFWFCAVGITIYVVALKIGGIIQGWEMIATAKNPDTGEVALRVPLFLDVVRHTVPYLVSRSLAGIMITIGHLAFAVHFVWMLLQPRAATQSQSINTTAMSAASRT